MKKTVLAMICACVSLMLTAQSVVKPAIPRDEKLEAKIEKTLSKMTLDEKVGQMLELNLDVIGTMDWSTGVWTLNETMLDTLISKYKVGSILNAPGTRAATVDQWQKWIRVIQKKSMKHIGIPDIYGLDHNHWRYLYTGRYSLPTANQPRCLIQHRACTSDGRGDSIREPRSQLSLGV